MTLKKLRKLFKEQVFSVIPDNKSDFYVSQLSGSTRSFLVDFLSNRHKNLLVVFSEYDEARFMQSDLEAIGNKKGILFPPTNHKPYDNQQVADTAMLVQRSEALDKIQSGKQKVVLTSTSALFEKVASSKAFNKASIRIEKGDQIEPEKLREQLSDQGYDSVGFVNEPGEFASRGGIMDVFPFSGDYPIRLEFFGDEIESIREFDPDSQRSVAFLEKARFVPDVSRFTQQDQQSLMEYLKEDTLLVLQNESLILGDIRDRFQNAEKLFDQHDDESLPAPDALFVNENEFKDQLSRYQKCYLGGFSTAPTDAKRIEFKTSPQPEFNASFKQLREHIEEQSKAGYRTTILCDNDGQKDRFEELLGDASDDFDYLLHTETLHEGFILHEQKEAVYTDHQIFNRYHRPKTRKRRYHGGISFKELKDLNIGDYVVHVDYGIGKFAGFKKIKVRDNEQEAVVMKYKGDSVLYVNVSSLHKLQKYSGKDGTEPRITKLGSGEWARKKAQTKKKVKDIARELILLYAKRKAQQAFAFSPDNAWQTELEASFEFEETPDQMEAINLVKNDMMSEQPMDRLVCGDVGFGKTEVAVRAAFKAVMDNKQVAVMVPTTILAEQHYKTFARRMAAFPVKVASISRFKTKAEQKKIIEQLEAGEIDVLIGTHRLASKDIKFKELGLLIIDEEQRFGVSVKEKLKEMRASVDVLTLTATPIPRTLQFSLMGARDLSTINTPPPNRQPVYTEIHSFNEELIRDAIVQEMARGGQVFFIHNRVKNIAEVADMVRSLVPDIRVRHAHGQMTGSQLEGIINDFYAHKFDVLVSTNIVENGIDISNANTISINHANAFGLSELHQLRGRVGRSNRKAFCYLITPPVETLTAEARKRLLALEEFSDLGSGFNIAMRDLDIRGAGDILGAEQSGFINDIGFELYTKILNDAVKELKESEFAEMFADVKTEVELPETAIEFDHSAYLPRHYVEANVERLNLYRKLSEAKTEDDIADWKTEITDRFGAPPVEAEYLILATKAKLFASRNYFRKVTIRSDRMWIICPKSESEAGEHFYGDGIFQELIEKFEKLKPGAYQVVQKDDAVRFVIQDIPDVESAVEFLKNIAPAVKEESLLQPH
jgi:transcription-repair coupling factor (superfamily II helicase)